MEYAANISMFRKTNVRSSSPPVCTLLAGRSMYRVLGQPKVAR